MNATISQRIINETEPASADMSDLFLVAAAKSGDASAFDELRNRHANKILRRIYRVTKNWEDAEDVLQESFMSAFIHLNNFEGRCAFSSWLTRIAINGALMHLRKKRRHVEVPIDAVDDASSLRPRFELQDHSPNPEGRYVQRQQEELFQGAVLRLRPEIRHMVELRHLHECSTKEIARRLGISEGAAKSRLMRARVTLRETVFARPNVSSVSNVSSVPNVSRVSSVSSVSAGRCYSARG